jgi:hypothetical protein
VTQRSASSNAVAAVPQSRTTIPASRMAQRSEAMASLQRSPVGIHQGTHQGALVMVLVIELGMVLIRGIRRAS